MTKQTDQTKTQCRVRRNVLTLTPEEVNNLRSALTRLYSTGTYQDFALNLPEFGHPDQNDLLFMPWARAFIYEFENLLRNIDPELFLPYWDYTGKETLEKGLPEIFLQETYEDNHGAIKANPLKPMLTYRETGKPSQLNGAKQLTEIAMQTSSFANFSTRIWVPDVYSHGWVGGTMTDAARTALDPVFWFSHAQLDRNWFLWQEKKSNDSVPESVTKALLDPWDLTGGDVLVTQKLGDGYIYL